jgi:hypothetical protein
MLSVVSRNFGVSIAVPLTVAGGTGASALINAPGAWLGAISMIPTDESGLVFAPQHHTILSGLAYPRKNCTSILCIYSEQY